MNRVRCRVTVALLIYGLMSGLSSNSMAGSEQLTTPTSQYSAALKAQLAEQYAEAARIFEAVLATDKEDAPLDQTLKVNTLSNLAYCYRKTGAYPQSVEAYQKAAALSPNNVEILRGLGQTYEHMQDFPRAIETFGQAIALNPNAYEDMIDRARVYMSLGSVDILDDSCFDEHVGGGRRDSWGWPKSAW